MRNVELKARDRDPARSLERALALGAEDKGEIRQRDTYFARARGRVKLREQESRGSPFWDHTAPVRASALCTIVRIFQI